MSVIELWEQDKQVKIPLYQWDNESLKQCFQKTSMQIFHANEIRLLELQESLNSSGAKLNEKQLIVKVYSIFQDMNLIFKRLGLVDLYQQLKMIFNTICKFSISFNHKDDSHQKKQVFKSSYFQIKQSKEHFKANFPFSDYIDEDNIKRKLNKFGGVCLYNQSYIKTMQKNIDKSKKSQQQNSKNKSQLDGDDPNDQLMWKEMIYYLQRKKQLTILKVKDNSKKYKQIQNEFKAVEEKLKCMIQSLQLKFQNQAIKDSQFLSKQQINGQLLNFNISMRSQLVTLKQQFNTASQALKQQNIYIKNRLNEQMARKNSMVSVQVQTIETAQSINLLKKQVNESQMKIKRLQIKIKQFQNKEKQLEDRHKQFSIKKQKQTASFYQSIFKKDDLISNLKKRCKEYEQTIKENQEKIQALNQIGNSDLQKMQAILAEILKEYKQSKNLGSRQKNFIKKRNVQSKFSQNKKYQKKKQSLLNNSRFSLSISQFQKILRKFRHSQMDNSSAKQQIQNKVKNQLNDRQNMKTFVSKELNFGQVRKESQGMLKLLEHKILNQHNSISQQKNRKANRLSRLSKQNQKNQRPSNFLALKAQANQQCLSLLNMLNNDDQLTQNEKRLKKLLMEKIKKSMENSMQKQVQEKLLTKIKLAKQNQYTSNQKLLEGKQVIKITKQSIKQQQQKQANLQQLKGFDEIEANLRYRSSKNFKNINKSKNQEKKLTEKQFKIMQLENKRSITLHQNNTNIDENKVSKVKKDKLKSSFLIKQLNTNLSNTNNNQNLQTLQAGFYNNSKSKEKLLMEYQNFLLAQISCLQSLDQQKLQQILSKYKQFKQLFKSMQKFDKDHVIYKSFVRVHDLKCKNSSCTHLQSFIKFCQKIQQSLGRKKVMRLHVQDFSNV